MRSSVAMFGALLLWYWLYEGSPYLVAGIMVGVVIGYHLARKGARDAQGGESDTAAPRRP